MLANRVRMGSRDMKSKELIIYDYGAEYKPLNFYTSAEYMIIERKVDHVHFDNQLARGAIYTGLIDVGPYNELHVNVDGNIYICDISQAKGNYRILIYSSNVQDQSFIGLDTKYPNYNTTPTPISIRISNWTIWNAYKLYQILLI